MIDYLIVYFVGGCAGYVGCKCDIYAKERQRKWESAIVKSLLSKEERK